jgi:hypothetical protein
MRLRLLRAVGEGSYHQATLLRSFVLESSHL